MPASPLSTLDPSLPPELMTLAMRAQIDDVITRLTAWADRPTVWRELQPVRLLLKQLLTQLDPLRLRLDEPLVIATFGGTGVGKSSLVNALLGEEIATVGRQRPTTTQPTLLVHTSTRLDAYQFPLDEMRVVRREARLLRDWVLVDCPDPDTSETDEQGSNLARVHAILPYCDVLLYVSTQQKYRSARVSRELALATQGCKLVFVQSHADQDEDIRGDWRQQLEPHFQVAEMFFVDSRRAMSEQLQGLRPTGDFGRLLDVLQQELSDMQRMRIRQGNLFGLVEAALTQSLQNLTPAGAAVHQLQESLVQQRHQLAQRWAGELETELLAHRGLWERRLLSEIADRWGLSPFSLVLRAWHSQASLLASWTLMRSRSTAQMALWGAVHTARWFSTQQRDQLATRQMEQAVSSTLSEGELREAQLILEGHARAAGLDRDFLQTARMELPRAAALAEEDFWTLARRRLDDEIAACAESHSRLGVRLLYEVAFSLLPLALLLRVGKNFFYDSWWLGQPLLETNFYIPAILFLLMWTAAALMLFTGRLRRGMRGRVRTIARQLADSRLPEGLFPSVDARCREFHEDMSQLEDLARVVSNLRSQVARTPGLSERMRDVTSASSTR